MKNRALFVSDIHIREAGDERGRLFLRWLQVLAEDPPSHLFLVGDIFDLWISAHDLFVGHYREIIDTLTALKERGVRIFYFEGNHDLDLEPFWRRRMGFDVFDRAAEFDLWNRSIRVEHGDQIDPDDRGYLFLRWLLRTPAMRWLGRHLPGFAVRWIGSKASRTSRKYTSSVKSITDSATRAKLERYAENTHRRSPFDILISGHVHVLVDETIEHHGKTFRLINLGTWLDRPMVFELTPDSAEFRDVDYFFN